jgi:hypothetical protein
MMGVERQFVGSSVSSNGRREEVPDSTGVLRVSSARAGRRRSGEKSLTSTKKQGIRIKHNVEDH